MFQRIKGAIDRTIAEEQARQKALSDQAAAGGGGAAAGHTRQSSSVSRSNSAASTQARKPRQKKVAQDASKDAEGGAANPDPAVFEAAFVIDDDEPSRSSTPLPPSEQKEKRSQNGDSKGDGDTGTGDNRDLEKKGTEAQTSDGDKSVPPPKSTTSLELPPDVRAKLRKLEKLEATYPG